VPPLGNHVNRDPARAGDGQDEDQYQGAFQICARECGWGEQTPSLFLARRSRAPTARLDSDNHRLEVYETIGTDTQWSIRKACPARFLRKVCRKCAHISGCTSLPVIVEWARSLFRPTPVYQALRIIFTSSGVLKLGQNPLSSSVLQCAVKGAFVVFGNSRISLHILRGVLAAAAIYGSLATMSRTIWPSIILLPAAVYLMKG
jgi:hypothetical protein